LTPGRFLKPAADRTAARFRKLALLAAAESLVKTFALPHKPAVANTPANLGVMKDAIAAAAVAAAAGDRDCAALREKAAVMARIGFDGGAETTADAVLAELDDAALSLDDLVPEWQHDGGSITDHPSFLTST